MQAYYQAQIRDLNAANQFRSRVIQWEWLPFRLEYARTLFGLAEYDAAAHECSEIASQLELPEENPTTESTSSRASTLATVKILWAECHIKMKRIGEALKKYRSMASKEHTLESMMSMAFCVATAEPEYGAAKIYQEVLSRWPYALEAAYELSKLNVPFKQATLVGISGVMKQGASNGEVVTLASNWLTSCYGRWSKIAEDYKGSMDRLMADTERQVEEEERRNLEEKLSGRTNSSLPLRLPGSIDDPLQLLTCVNLAMYRGAYQEIELFMKRVRLPEDQEMFGQEYEAYADFKTGRRTRLTLRQSEAMAKSPFRWETWFVTAMKEWSDRRVSEALKSVQHAQTLLSAPSPLLFIVKAYMQLFRIKDALLRNMIEADETAVVQQRKTLAEATKLCIEATKDAWSMSKDPFVTQALLEIHTSIARLVTDVKVIEVIAEVDAKNPILKRFKTNPAVCLAEAAEHSDLAKIYARLLARKARLCVCKHGLVTMAVDTANNALKFDPHNGLAKATLILADRLKTAGGPDKPLEELEEAANKAVTAEAKWALSMESIPLLLELGQLDRAQTAITKFHPINPLDNEVIYYTELVRIRIEAEMDEEEEEEDPEEEV